MPSFLPNPAQYDLAHQLNACQSRSRRNGKVARLPAPLRAQINRMLDDGVPYKLIIEKLGPAGQHLNEDNLSNWRLGGYHDYLNAQAVNDRARTQTEAAADLLRQEGHLDPRKLQQVCGEIALLQYLDTIMEHGEQLARDALQKNPAKFITLINACSNMSNANIAIERHEWKTQPLRSGPPVAVRQDSPGSHSPDGAPPSDGGPPLGVPPIHHYITPSTQPPAPEPTRTL